MCSPPLGPAQTSSAVHEPTLLQTSYFTLHASPWAHGCMDPRCAMTILFINRNRIPPLAVNAFPPAQMIAVFGYWPTIISPYHRNLTLQRRAFELCDKFSIRQSNLTQRARVHTGKRTVFTHSSWLQQRLHLGANTFLNPRIYAQSPRYRRIDLLIYVPSLVDVQSLEFESNLFVWPEWNTFVWTASMRPRARFERKLAGWDGG